MATAKTPTTEELTAQIETLKADISQLTQLVSDLSKAKGQDLSDAARAKVSAARAAGEDQMAHLQQQAMSQMEDAEEYVRRNPATALGIAAGVGVLVGMLSARR